MSPPTTSRRDRGPMAAQASDRSLRPGRSAASRRTAAVALASNVTIAVAKIAAGAVSGSAAMYAESAHSLADTVNQTFLLHSIGLSERPADSEHPFGSGRERFLWTFVAAIGTFLAGAIFAIGWGVYELISAPGGETEFVIPFVVLGLSLLTEGFSWLRALRQTRSEARHEKLGYLDYVRLSRDPNVKMVLFEDSAALIGIGLAAIGIGLQAITGIEFWDPLASVAIGLMLIVVAFWMARDARYMLVGASARPDERLRLEAALNAFPEVEQVRELLTLTLGPNALLVAARIDLADGLDADRIERVSDEIDSRMHEVVDDVTEVFVDATPPDRAA
ncbi:MAG TPA: cation diffusion facilitator family transporter [Solirubrobacterales bacterium]|nr:cation diffusion facilitator family transporter [Solirubrobacterales bacterium]